ncbi:hypothetical protein ACH5RR_025158 [Cinchona calisaya]|uniref:Nucleoporin protein Ndc1-Nup n=1 Tax=Cinchona calisaya TaxID=153742 RepID=A0ABD2Z0U1_9GENT
MSLSTALFQPQNGAVIIKHRFISFLIWQSILSTISLLLLKSLLLFPFPSKSPSIFLSLLSFLSFHVSLLSFSACLFILSSPHPHKPASPLDLLLGSARLIFLPSNNSNLPPPPQTRLAVRVSLSFVLFVVASALSGFVSLVSILWSCGAFVQTRPWRLVVAMLGLRGFLMGVFYAVYYVYKQRWVLQFPIIQTPLFFSFKMGLLSSIGQAFKLSTAGYFFSSLVVFFFHDEYESKVTMGKYTVQQLILYIGNFLMFLCWELSHHLYQVINTKRFIFAPPKGSAAAETNPSEYLLAALEESTPKSLLQYLAYLDLCMVCERNVDTWRRAAFFEETGETYKRVIVVCLRPLEELTLKLGESMEGSVQKSSQLSDQLRSPTDRLADSRICESFNDFQLCAWCARIVASLTACSRKEDRFGVAQLFGNNAAVISTLLSALIAVETFMGKKTALPSSNHLMGAAGIKWAQMGTGSRDSPVGLTEKRRGSPVYMKAYALADIMRTSMYCIVSAFHDEMLDSAKAGNLEKDWITSTKALYGTCELLSQKLRLFLDFQAC